MVGATTLISGEQEYFLCGKLEAFLRAAFFYGPRGYKDPHII